MREFSWLFYYLLPSSSPLSLFCLCFSCCYVDPDCFGLRSGPWMRVQSSDSVVYAVITRGSFLSVTGCLCFLCSMYWSCSFWSHKHWPNLHEPAAVLIVQHGLCHTSRKKLPHETLISHLIILFCFILLFIPSVHWFLIFSWRSSSSRIIIIFKPVIKLICFAFISFLFICVQSLLVVSQMMGMQSAAHTNLTMKRK